MSLNKRTKRIEPNSRILFSSRKKNLCNHNKKKKKLKVSLISKRRQCEKKIIKKYRDYRIANRCQGLEGGLKHGRCAKQRKFSVPHCYGEHHSLLPLSKSTKSQPVSYTKISRIL